VGQVVVLDYSHGNANAMLRALSAVQADAIFSNDPETIGNATAIVLPGVGHAGRAMHAIDQLGLRVPLKAAAFERKIPILGVCLGMQIMTDHIAEGDCAGLGWVGGRAVEMTVDDRRRYKVPHIGWNSVDFAARSKFSNESASVPAFYFCHKFEVVDLSGRYDLSHFNYERQRVAAFEQDNLTGVQFHPEKSHDAGVALFRTWLGRIQ
jgi:glutamine amidotransferase